MSAPVETTITSPLWKPKVRWRTLVRRAVDACALDCRARHADYGWSDRSISVLLCDDNAIRDLNRTWRGFDKPTNVLSFPAPSNARVGGPLGDIAIAYETVALEADRERKGIEDHVTHLVIHGVLHLLGHDHLQDADAAAMEAGERRILATLGIADPYADPVMAEPAL